MAITDYILDYMDAFNGKSTTATDKHLFLYDDGKKTKSSHESQTEQI